MATAIPDWRFQSALLYWDNYGTILKYLAQHETTQQTNMGDDSGVCHHSIAEAFTAWTTTREYQQAMAAYDSVVVLRWFYGNSDAHRALFEPLAPVLAAQLVDLLPSVAQSSHIEAMDVLLNSWLFLEHLTDAQQISVMTKSLWSTSDPAIAKILAAYGGFSLPVAPPGRFQSNENSRFIALTRAQLQNPNHNSPSINIVGDPWPVRAAIDSTWSMSLEKVRAFLQAGADSHGALESAARWRGLDMIRMLFNDGMVDIDGSYGRATTPLVEAIRTGRGRARANVSRIQVATLLLELGADINASGTNGKTPIVAAALMRGEEMLTFLLAQGADPNIGTWYGLSAVSILCRRRIQPLHCGYIKLLLEHGANPNCTDWRGDTVLHRLGRKGYHEMKFEVIKLLLQFGGDMHLRNEKGKTPLDLLKACAPARVAELQQMNLLVL